MATVAETEEETPVEPGEEAPEEPAEEPEEEVEEPGTAEPGEPTEEPQGFNEQGFEKEQRRHERELKKVFGDAFGGMGACETCGGVGFTPQDFTPPPPILDDPSLVVCDACNGHAARRTPSLDEGHKYLACTVCGGTGYRDRLTLESQRQAEAYSAQQAAPQGQPVQEWNPATQQWEWRTPPPPAPPPGAYPPPPPLS